jgi:hypothetical protein
VAVVKMVALLRLRLLLVVVVVLLWPRRSR